MDIIKLGGIFSVIIGGITLFQKITPIISGINQILENVKENSIQIKSLSDELKKNSEANEKFSEKQAIILRNNRNITRQHLMDIMNVVRARGYLKKDEWYQINELYKDYEDLDGNNIIPDMFKEICKLPILED